MHLLIQADQDGELDADAAATVQAHLAGCTDCTAYRDRLAALSATLRQSVPRHAAPDRLVRTALALERPPASGFPRWLRAQGAGLAVGAALAASIAVAVMPPSGEPPIEVVVADHLRALQPGHLMDVVSTDRHTVKPWFDGRLDFAPPVRDFAAAGFPLKGARLDFLAKQAVAALVYGREKHLIDVFVWPAPASRRRSGAARGYNTLRWSSGGMQFWAVSDLNAQELARFQQLWTAAD